MELKNLQFSFDTKKSSSELFKNFHLKIADQKITVILGPSGCGKSTLLRIFSELVAIENKDQTLVKSPQTESFVFQEACLLEWKTGYENIMLPFKISKKDIDRNYFEKVAQILKIKDVLNLYPYQLSGGQKMRVSIARALVTKPGVLYMDEPFSALDEPTRLELQDEFLTIQRDLQMTVLFVTHSFYEAVYLADRMIILSQKKPVQILFDDVQGPSFQSRFEEAYQKKVQMISDVFKSGLL